MNLPRQPRPWLPELLTRVAVASGVGYVAAGYTISRWLTRPSRGRPVQTPGDHGLDWEPLECRTADGIRLAGWAVTPAQPRGTIALFHGMRHNRQQTLGRLAMLVAAGYRCVAFDHRAHGTSNGKRTSFGYHEGRDVSAVLDLVDRRWPREPAAVLGMSMGAAAICFAARQACRLEAIVLESLYHDLSSTFTNRIGTTYPAWFGRLFPGVVWITERRLHVALNHVAPISHISNLAPAPVLLLTGTEDTHAPPADAERLFAGCHGPRDLWLVPGAGHKNVFELAGEAYRDRVVGFLDKWMGNATLSKAPAA